MQNTHRACRLLCNARFFRILLQQKINRSRLKFSWFLIACYFQFIFFFSLISRVRARARGKNKTHRNSKRKLRRSNEDEVGYLNWIQNERLRRRKSEIRCWIGCTRRRRPHWAGLKSYGTWNHGEQSFFRDAPQHHQAASFKSHVIIFVSTFIESILSSAVDKIGYSDALQSAHAVWGVVRILLALVSRSFSPMNETPHYRSFHVEKKHVPGNVDRSRATI